MKKTIGLLVSLVAIVVFLFGPALQGTACAAGKSVIQVSAAISLKDALAVLKEIYEKKKPDVDIRFNLASSGMLQKQIEEGAPVDLFISAGKKQMDELAAKGLTIPDSRSNLLGNEMALLISKEKKGVITSFADLADKAQSISIGQPETVPAGTYGKETLANLKLWDKVKKKIMFAKDVRQVLSYVDSGNVDAGLVYVTDTVALKSGIVVATAPKGSHSPILYPMAVIKDGKNRAGAKDFMAFLKTAEAGKVFARYKFIPVTGKQ
jgi:molybdate transport system substrate-binding protein